MRSKKLFEQIYNLDNLFYAWKKAKYIYDHEVDFIPCIEELAEFEANLDDNLEDISKQIEKGVYSLDPITPLWLPKAGPEPEDRQHFIFSVRDQVVWIAIINVIGPILDNVMPYWSFGNRLYMPIWKEYEQGDKGRQERTVPSCKTATKITRFGYYSSSSPKLYRNWTSSWPLFRKAISISVKVMANLQNDYTKEELEDIEMYENAPESFKIKCWNKEYWRPSPGSKDIYYASIDLKKFYPSINNKDILNPKVIELLDIKTNNDPLKVLIENLLDFHLVKDPLQPVTSDEMLIGINKEAGTFSGIPTGLFVAGFLANIAMLPIDNTVYFKQMESRNIGHFRFVDDHVFIAYTFDDLCDWIEEYENILKEQYSQLKVNYEKVGPAELRDYLYPDSLKNDAKNGKGGTTETRKNARDRACIACKLDPRLPSPFTTLTLRKLSDISASPFDLLDEVGKKELLRDVEHILAIDFPKEEIREDTRVSWAASIMIRLVPSIEINLQEQYDKRQAMELAFQERKNNNLCGDSEEKEYLSCKEQIDKDLEKTYSHIFSLLIKALNDNIAKPKLWRKCVAYCCATGFSGISRLLKVLSNDPSLTQNGREYIFASLIGAITKNVLRSINIEKSNHFTSREKESASRFVEEIFKIKNKIISLEKSKFHTKYNVRVMHRLITALSLYELECNDKLTTITTDRATICFLWLYLPMYTRHANHFNTPAVIRHLSNDSVFYMDDMVYKKILLMFPNELTDEVREEISSNLLSPKSTGRRQIDKKKFISLQEMFTSQRGRTAPCYSFDLFRSEWTILMIVRMIMDEIIKVGDPKEATSLSSLIELNQDTQFINCAPCNFYVDQDIIGCNSWKEIRDFLEKDNKKPPIAYRPVCSDYRFDSKFYNRAGIALEKRQIYSCAVLLLVLLSGSMEFNPLVGRSSSFDRNYKLLLDKLEGISVSSYTQAILIGAMSDKVFELQNYSVLDMPTEGRTEAHQNSPLKIDTISRFRKELGDAIGTLESYQLSLQDQAPRQLIPLSLENLTKDYNPYTKEGSE